MSTLTKSTAELTHQNLDSSTAPTVRIPRPAVPGAAPSPQCAEIPVRVRSLPDGAAESADAFAEDTQTLILFPRGAVVRLAAPVKPGQELILTNLKSQQNVHCKVVSVRPSEKEKGYVELQFTHRTPGFWGNSLTTAKAASSTTAPVKARSTAAPAAVNPARVQRVAAVATRASDPAAPSLDMETTKNRVAEDLHPGRKWFLTGASIAAAVLAVAGGVSMFQSRPAIAASAGADVAPQIIVVRSDEEPAKSSAGLAAAGPAAASHASNAKSGGSGETIPNSPAKPHLSIGSSKLNSPAAAQPVPAPTADELPAVTSDDASAPVVEGAVPGGILSAGAAPIAPLISAPPRAISTVLPQYPATAKSAHIAGEVTIQAEIDASGKVVGMRVISGPAQLQPAALEALLQWTYEPARRDGQPVSGQVLETFKFRRQ